MIKLLTLFTTLCILFTQITPLASFATQVNDPTFYIQSTYENIIEDENGQLYLNMNSQPFPVGKLEVNLLNDNEVQAVMNSDKLLLVYLL